MSGLKSAGCPASLPPSLPHYPHVHNGDSKLARPRCSVLTHLTEGQKKKRDDDDGGIEKSGGEELRCGVFVGLAETERTLEDVD